MRKTLIVARREMANYLFSPMAYVVGAVFLAVSSILFFYGFPPLRVDPVFVNGGDASLKTLFYDLAWVMVFIAPLLTMRLVCEEYRSGTIEKLATAPISETAIIAGKFLGVLALYAMLLATTLVFLILVASFGKPDPGVALMGYLGMLLLGAAFLAVGLFTSCITRYQVLGALVGVAILSLFALLMQEIVGSTRAPELLREAADRMNAMSYFRDFARGVFDTRGLVYFLTATVLFLFLSVKTLESRRWR
jgi:ABC-2 type transport system permease protein